ncbi:MAG TPA: DUF5615 family PIN-like protein [Candidatus Avalokitesvara rifleensis]|uniref:DUF5615 family PIN-like protein n=1 Tax=Candidatus Avalokitesvara rifleensis TaxID=3367620 RepID=UPI0027128018|nr:DUF5615 family PIN-like protein [Candidatus Brocadiales bacterium]
MRYIANENIPLESISALKSKGIDIISLKDVTSSGAKDEEVLNICGRKRAILITFDKDFGELAFKKGTESRQGIILLRIKPQSSEYVTKMLLRLFQTVLGFEGHFTTVTEERIRQVPLKRA